MKINIYLPFKETFSLDKASAVSITVKNNLAHSSYKNKIRIFGNYNQNPMYSDKFVGVKKSLNIFKSKNKYIAEVMCNQILKEDDQNQIIEIHNRPYVFNYVFKKLPQSKICLFFHNNPKEMKGSLTVKQRIFILENASMIYCVSNYIKREFLDGILKNYKNIKTVHNGVQRSLKIRNIKNKEVIFVGRIVYEKGVHLFVKAVSMLAKDFPDWKFSLIGSTRLGSSRNSKYATKIINEFLKIGPQANYHGFLTHNQVNKKFITASVIVVPSIWPEPFGLVIAEAMSFGVAIVSSNVGGITEIVQENGIVIDKINYLKIYSALNELMSDSKKLEKYQELSWKNFKHSSILSSKKLDQFRSQIV